MVSLAWIVSFISVLPFFFLDEAFEIAELMLPHVAIVREPVVHVLERLGVEAVESVAADFDLGNELRLAQDAQVLGDRRTADRKIAGYAADGLATLPQKRQDGAPGRVGERLEDDPVARRIGNITVTHTGRHGSLYSSSYRPFICSY